MDKEDTFDEEIIKDIMNHLDRETAQGTVRMSVNMDPEKTEEKTVSHECCRIYGKTASEVVNLLDAYTDLSAGEPDREA